VFTLSALQIFLTFSFVGSVTGLSVSIDDTTQFLLPSGNSELSNRNRGVETIDKDGVGCTTTDNGGVTSTDNGGVRRTTTDNGGVGCTTTDNGGVTSTDNGGVRRTTTDYGGVGCTTTDNGSVRRTTTDNGSVGLSITTDNGGVRQNTNDIAFSRNFLENSVNGECVVLTPKCGDIDVSCFKTKGQIFCVPEQCIEIVTEDACLHFDIAIDIFLKVCE
jgi:hypothetical protein